MIHFAVSFDPLDGFLCNEVHSVENWMLNTEGGICGNLQRF